MKTLYLLRHAESGWKDARLQDFDRTLNDSGRQAAPLVGLFLRERKLRVDSIISSPAVRARQTAALVKESAGLSAELLFDGSIYEADSARLLEVVARAGEPADSLMLVGHNPGMEGLLLLLTGEERQMRTASLACVALEVEKWAQVRGGVGRLEWLARPGEPANE